MLVGSNNSGAYSMSDAYENAADNIGMAGDAQLMMMKRIRASLCQYLRTRASISFGHRDKNYAQ